MVRWLFQNKHESVIPGKFWKQPLGGYFDSKGIGWSILNRRYLMVCPIHTVDFIYFHIESSSICLLVGSDNCYKKLCKVVFEMFPICEQN